MNWSNIKWSNYISFLNHQDNINRFAILGGITQKEFMNNDKLALGLLELNENDSFKSGDIIKYIQIGKKKQEVHKKSNFQQGLMCVDIVDKFVKNEHNFVEMMFVDFICIHCQVEFTDEEKEIIKKTINEMPVTKVWPIGNFFFQKYSKYLSKLIISNNCALISQIS